MFSLLSIRANDGNIFAEKNGFSSRKNVLLIGALHKRYIISETTRTPLHGIHHSVFIILSKYVMRNGPFSWPVICGHFHQPDHNQDIKISSPLCPGSIRQMYKFCFNFSFFDVNDDYFFLVRSDVVNDTIGKFMSLFTSTHDWEPHKIHICC